MKLLFVFIFVYLASGSSVPQNTIIEKYKDENISQGKRYKPEWKDLDTRPLPQWYDQAKIGIFLHWGVYCVPGYKSEWFWHSMKVDNDTKSFMQNNYTPGFTYQQFAPSFKAEFFDPFEWAELFQKAGVKYVVLTSKHHEGYTLFPSNQTFSWNSVDVGPHRDLVKDLSKAVREHNIEFGVYHSLFEWYNPMYVADEAAHFKTRRYVDNKLRPDIEQLINDYKPSIFWSDGDQGANDTYWNSTNIIAWMYNDSPVNDKIVVNDRWGIGTFGKHGDFYNFADRFRPDKLIKHKWESAFTLDRYSWGYRRNMKFDDVLSPEELLGNIVSAVSCGGNALINVGPTKEGTIDPIFQERLLTLGAWLEINGEAIYKSSPWLHQNDTENIWYTCTKTEYDAMNPTAPPQNSDTVTAIFAISLQWPEDNILQLTKITSTLNGGNYKAVMLGQESKSLEFNISNGITDVQLPDKSTVQSEHAWTIKFTKL